MTEHQTPGSEGFLALQKYAAELAIQCDGETAATGRCTRPATWGVRLGVGSGVACQGCKDDIDRARFTKPGGLEWVRLNPNEKGSR